MEFLTQMARNAANAKAFAAQPNHGLSSPGGSGSGTGSPVSGNATGKAGANRTVNQAAGVIQNAPADFRDALENYYHGLEHTKE